MFIAIVLLSGALLFAPNPDLDGNGYGDTLRVETRGIYLDNGEPKRLMLDTDAVIEVADK